jgi:hypothetical protein
MLDLTLPGRQTVATHFATFVSRLSGNIADMAYSFDGMFLYLASDSRQVSRCNFAVATPCGVRGTIPGSKSVRRLAVDPANSQNVAAVLTRASFAFTAPAVFYSTNGGSAWNDVSVPGSLVTTAGVGGAVAYVRNGAGPEYLLAVATSNGVLIQDGGIGVGWKLLAHGLPKTLMGQMIYDATDDLLIVATMGRGVWFLGKASSVASGALPGSFTDNRIPDPDSGFTLDDKAASIIDLVPPDDYIQDSHQQAL